MLRPREAQVTISTDPHDQSSAPDLASDPYGFFDYMRKTEPVWRGTLMDTSIAPPGPSSAEEWTLFDFDSVFAPFRDDAADGPGRHNPTTGLGFGATSPGSTA